MGNKSNFGARGRGTIVVGVLLSVLFFWLAIRDVNIDGVAVAFSEASTILAVPILFILGAYYWLKAIRWSRLLAPVRVLSTRILAPPMMIGLAANNLLPAHMGELVRMYLLARMQKIPSSTVLATLVVERVFDIVSILLLVAIATTRSDLTEEFAAAGLFLFGLAALILGSILFLVVAEERFICMVSVVLRFLPNKIVDKIVRQLKLAASGVESLRSWRSYPALLLNSVLQWLLMASAIILSMKAFGVDAPVESAILVLGLIVAGITLPSSPGFFGTVEFCFVFGLSAYGIDASTALSTAIFYHILTWGTATATGIAYLHVSGLHLSDIRSPNTESTGS